MVKAGVTQTSNAIGYTINMTEMHGGSLSVWSLLASNVSLIILIFKLDIHFVLYSSIY